MTKYTPLATLVAVVLLGGGLLVANMIGDPANRAPAAAPSAAVAAAPSEWVGAAAPKPETAPPPAPAVAEKAYTGRSAGNEVTVALAVKDGRAVAYACDGKRIEAWLEGTLTGNTLTLQGKTSSLTATLDEKATLGTITVDGTEWPFSAKGVAAPAGLYEGRGTLRGVAARVGWIVDDKGEVTGVLSAGGTRVAAPPLDPRDPAATTIGGTPAAVTALDGDAQVIPR